MKRQGMLTSIQELYDLIETLEENFEVNEYGVYDIDNDRKFQINIINKQPKCSDTWEIEK